MGFLSLFIPGSRKERLTTFATDDRDVGRGRRSKPRNEGLDWVGEHAGCMDTVSVVEKRRIEGPLYCALPPLDLPPRIATHFPVTIY